MKTRNRYWLLLLLAAVFSLALAACDANDLTPDTGGDRAVDGSPRPGDDGDGDDDGIDYSADDDGDGLADLEDVTVDERVEFIGRVESIADGAWLVDDCRLVLVEETEVEGADDDRDDKDKDKDKDDEDGDRDDDLNIEEGDVVRVKALLTSGTLVAEQIVVANEEQAERYLEERGDDDDDDRICLLVGEDRDRGFGFGNEGDDNPGRGNDGDDNPGRGRGPGEGND